MPGEGSFLNFLFCITNCQAIHNPMTMKKFFLLLFILPVLAFAQTNRGFSVTGTIAGLPDSTEVKLISTTQESTVLATGLTKGSIFTLKGQISEPGLYWLDVGGEKVHIYLENVPMMVKGTKADLKNLSVAGSASHKDFIQFRDIFNPLVAELNAAVGDINREPDESKKPELIKKYEATTEKIKQQVESFVSTRKSSYVSPFLLYISAQLYDDPMFLDRQYLQLTEEIRNSNIGKLLGEYIAYNKVGAIGSDALEFTQADPAGNMVALSSFRGKYVLIDFWASWCKPCRVENPHVVKAFQKFNNKNFTILGVSLDQEKEAWLKAIDKDGLTWTQVSDLKGWSNETAQLYRVQGIPQNFLIDPNGKIVAKNLRGADLEAKLCELLGCN